MFKKLFRSAAVSLSERDFDLYLKALEGGSDSERGILVLQAQTARLSCEQALGIPPAALLCPFTVPPKRLTELSTELAQLQARFAKSGSEGLAAGLAIWLHTLRAVQMPELRTSGRRLWGMLARGFEDARLLLATMPAPLSGMPEVHAGRLVAEIDAIPSGLEPRDAQGNQLMPGTPGDEIVAAIYEQQRREEAEAERARQAEILRNTPSLEERAAALKQQLKAALAKRQGESA